ncbi:hypothetical protein B0T10DRAFT_531992 [Thelonectria olida]|uniref:Uncharacterized protein n=1 Tax=Thelonectria olida TaxID=1576542 RepID=A0A9P8VVI1_9HYPO|nr:hypothetical protein B0T10DRAFT_531992 [Thelonectria olida]
MRFSKLLTAAAYAATFAQARYTGIGVHIPKERVPLPAQGLFDYSIAVGDNRWDEAYHLVTHPEQGPWSIRSTAWYAAALLHRYRSADDQRPTSTRDDSKAFRAIDNILKAQLNDTYGPAWAGTFKLSPDEPFPTKDSPLYYPRPYGSQDPTSRELVATELIQLMEEFEGILGKQHEWAIKDALEITAAAAMRRNGTFPEGDDLTVGYINTALVRSLVVGWIGRRLNNKEYIDFANSQGSQILNLFKDNGELGEDALSESGLPSYYGLDLWALAANIKYGPPDSTMTHGAQYIMTELWRDVAAHWNPYLGNLVAPYDNSYTRDLSTQAIQIALFSWGIFGYGYGPQIPRGELGFLRDGTQGASLALVMETTSKLMARETFEPLTNRTAWEGWKFVNRTVSDGLGKHTRRTASSWMSIILTIGVQPIDEDETRDERFVPAIVHWASDKMHAPWPYVSFFSLYPSAATIDAVAGRNSLTVSYPNPAQEGARIFTYALSNVPPGWTISGNHVIDGFESLPCLDVKVDAPGLIKQPVTYGDTHRNHMIYNISYVVPDGFKGVPKMEFQFKYTC